jgi:hypothetical protein
MKSAEQELESCLNLPIYKTCHKEFSVGFKKGVEFAKKWTPIEDELPPSGETVLLKYDNFDCVVGFYTHSQNFMVKLFSPLGINNVEINNVTHWRLI